MFFQVDRHTHRTEIRRFLEIIMPPHARGGEEGDREEEDVEARIIKWRERQRTMNLDPTVCAWEGDRVVRGLESDMANCNIFRLQALLWITEGQLDDFFRGALDHTALYPELRFGPWPREDQRAAYINSAIIFFQMEKARRLDIFGWHNVRMARALPVNEGNVVLQPRTRGQRLGARTQINQRLVDVTANPVTARVAKAAAQQCIRQMNRFLGRANTARIERILWLKEARVQPHPTWLGQINREFVTPRGGRHIQDDVRTAKDRFLEKKHNLWPGVLPPGEHLPEEPGQNAPESPPPQPTQ